MRRGRSTGCRTAAVLAMATAFRLLGAEAAHGATDARAGAVAREPAMQGAAAQETALLHTVNQERVKRGLEPLGACRSLSSAAREHSVEMRDRDRVGHDSRAGTSLLERACEAGFGRACRSGEKVAETVAAGQPDPSRVLAAWLASPGHRRIVLDPDLTLAGAGLAAGGRLERYWTMIYASGSDPSCSDARPSVRGATARSRPR